MKNNTKDMSYASGPIFGILTIIFVISKILGLINWSWWIVLIFLWLPFAIGLAMVTIAFTIGVLLFFVGYVLDKKGR